MFRSEQEAIVYSLAQILLGGQALFKPNNYAGGMKEPADLVWIANRCAVLMYMTSGRKSFDKKRQHNHSQMHRWIRHWRQGAVLSGNVAGENRTFLYDEIDQIIGLSIISGSDSGCIYEDDQVIFANSKLSACATITDDVFVKLSRRSVGIRDVLHLIVAIREIGGRVDQNTIFDFLDGRAAIFSERSRREFSGYWSDSSDLKNAWTNTRHFLTSIKNSNEAAVANELFADLTLEDAIWMSVAERSVSRVIAKPGEFGPIKMGVRRRSGIYTLTCVVFAHMGVCKGSNTFTEVGSFDLLLSSFLELGPENPIRMLVVTPPSQGLERMLTMELRSLRAVTFAKT